MNEHHAQVSRTSDGLQHRNTFVPRGICFVFVQLRDDTTDKILANTGYVVKGLLQGTNISGATDKDGVLRHEYLRDDHYQLSSSGVTECIETYYIDEMENYEGKPWVLRLRS
jgi:hypothetical protein